MDGKYYIRIRISNLFSLIHLFLFLISCTPESDRLSFALRQAGDNRLELEKILDYYSANKHDSLKYKAARFLIENMPGHYSYQGTEILSYYDEIGNILDGNFTAKEKKDTIEKVAARYPGLKEKTIEDVQIITANYLIRNIDHSFQLWEKPWASHLNFVN